MSQGDSISHLTDWRQFKPVNIKLSTTGIKISIPTTENRCHYRVRLNKYISSKHIPLRGNSRRPKETSTCAKGNISINARGGKAVTY